MTNERNDYYSHLVPTTPIKKSCGVTASEERLCRLGYRTFLSLWSYPNVFKKHPLPKELCDLLVVFENHIIIFSDKDCAFGSSGNIKVDWTRWYKKSILASAQQLCGAKTWIKKCPDRICMDEKGEIDFPLKIEINENTVFHLIAIAHGADEACRSFFGGGDGGLIVTNDPVWDVKDQENCNPFFIGQILPDKKEFIHVFDDSAYATVLEEMDTISDFISYLTDKEALFGSNANVRATGENELLACHVSGLISGSKSGLCDTLKENPGVTTVCFEEGLWEELLQSTKYHEWKRNLKESYFIDSLLNKTFNFVEHGLSTTNDPSIDAQSELFRFLVRDDRVHRASLAHGFLSFFQGMPANYRGTRIIYNEEDPSICYLLLLLPNEKYMDEESYRKVRYEMLMDYCAIAKSDLPKVKIVIGIAHETNEELGSSEDFMSFDAQQWTIEDQMSAERVKKEYIEKGLLGKQS